MDFPFEVWSVFRCPNKTGYSKVDTPYVMGFWTVYFVVLQLLQWPLLRLSDRLSVCRFPLSGRRSAVANRKSRVASRLDALQHARMRRALQLATGNWRSSEMI